MKKTFLLLAMLFFFLHCIIAQNTKIDNLFLVLKATKEDTNKLKILNELTWELRRNNPDTAIYFANEAIVLATKLNYKKGIAKSYHFIGIVYKMKGDYPEALKNYFASLKIKEEIGDKNGIAKSYYNIGIVYGMQGNYPDALKNYFATLKISEEIGYKEGVAASYNSIGTVYNNQGNYPEALKNHFACLKIEKEIGYKEGIAASYNSIGNVYENQGNYPEALKNQFASLKIREEIGDKKEIAGSYNNIGNVYYLQGDYLEALKKYFAALKIREEIGDKKDIVGSYNNIGNVYYNQGNYPEALKNHFASLKIAEEIGDKSGIASSYNNIGNVYFSQGIYPDALKNYFASLKIKAEIGDKSGIAGSISNIGIIYTRQKKYKEAEEQLIKARDLSKEIGHIEFLKNIYSSLAMLDSTRGKEAMESGNWQEGTSYYRNALENYKRYIVLRDSMYNEENTKKTVQSAMQYEFDKKELATQKEIQLTALRYEFEKKQAAAKTEQERKQLLYEEDLKRKQIEFEFAQKQAKVEAEHERKQSLAKAEQEKKDAIAIEEMQRQKLVRNSFMGGFIVVLLFAIVFFMQRTRISKEKKRSEALLLNILPSEVAEELKQKGSAAAKQFDDVTVIFTDFKGFTQIAEKLSPVELVAEIDVCFKAFDNIMGKHNIEKIKTIGDSYMAAGGLPVANKTNATDVVDAALDIQKFMHEYAAQKKKEGKEVFEMRIGVHTGPVVAGIVGVKKFAYDIWGDTVNIASRMESSGEPGKVNISGSTYELVKDKYKCTHRGKIEAKNKGMVDMYFVEGIS